MNTRRTFMDVEINGVSITADISEDVTDFSYNDNAADEADDISLTVQNRDGKWMKDWMPREGDTITSRIRTENPSGQLECGDAIIDEISFSGWPMKMNLKGLAMPMDTDFSDVEKNRTWSEATLSSIAQSVADADGIPLEYDASYDPTLSFVSQTEESDKVFLHDLCEKHGLTLKLYSTRIVIYDMAELEGQGAVMTLTPEEMDSFRCKSSIANTGYTACTVAYLNRDGETLEYTHTIDGKTDKEYRHDTVMDNLAQAQRIAESKLAEKNREQTTFSCSGPGDVRIVSGICANLSGFGSFDGKYLIDSAAHTVGGGYTTSLEAHRVV